MAIIANGGKQDGDLRERPPRNGSRQHQPNQRGQHQNLQRMRQLVEQAPQVVVRNAVVAPLPVEEDRMLLLHHVPLMVDPFDVIPR